MDCKNVGKPRAKTETKAYRNWQIAQAEQDAKKAEAHAREYSQEKIAAATLAKKRTFTGTNKFKSQDNKR
jgi:hypothetical protein